MKNLVVVGWVCWEKFWYAVQDQFLWETNLNIHNIIFKENLRSVIDKTKKTIWNLLQDNNNQIVLLWRSGGWYAVMQALKELKEENYKVDEIKKIILQCTPISSDDLKISRIKKIWIKILPSHPRAKFAKDIQNMWSIEGLVNEYKNKIIYHYAKDDEVIHNHLVTKNIVEKHILTEVPSLHNFVVDKSYDFINDLTKETILKAFRIAA